jgi:hypothetical protein
MKIILSTRYKGGCGGYIGNISKARKRLENQKKRKF